MKLLRTVKAARKDILSRKDSAAATGVRPSRAMVEVWDRGLVPSGGAFSFLTDPFSRQHVQFTSDWLSLLRETVDKILTDLKKLRDSERKQAEAQSRRAAIQQMYEGRGALRRFLHDSEPHAPAPFLLTPLPNRITFSCANVDPRDIMESIKQIDQRIRVSHVLDQITVREIPPSSLHRVLSTPGIGPGVNLTSQGGLVSSPHDRLTCWEFSWPPTAWPRAVAAAVVTTLVSSRFLIRTAHHAELSTTALHAALSERSRLTLGTMHKSTSLMRIESLGCLPGLPSAWPSQSPGRTWTGTFRHYHPTRLLDRMACRMSA